MVNKVRYANCSGCRDGLGFCLASFSCSFLFVYTFTLDVTHKAHLSHSFLKIVFISFYFTLYAFGVMVLDSLELELLTVLSCHMGTRN